MTDYSLKGHIFVQEIVILAPHTLLLPGFDRYTPPYHEQNSHFDDDIAANYWNDGRSGRGLARISR